METTTDRLVQIIGEQQLPCCAAWHLSAAQRLRRVVVTVVWSLAAMTAGVAQAVPVPLAGEIDFTTSTDCSPWCGSAEAKANIIGVDGSLANGQFQGAGAASTSAVLGGGGFFGKTAAATASFEWWAWVMPAAGAGDDPFHLFFDWDLSLFSSHDALLGQAVGGAEVNATWYKCVPSMFGCFPFQTFSQQRVYTDPVFAGEEWGLGLYDPSMPYGILHVTLDVGSAAATTPWIGVYASAIDIAVFGFTLRADDGRAPPAPVPEPSSLAMTLAGLTSVIWLLRRRSAPGRQHRL